MSRSRRRRARSLGQLGHALDGAHFAAQIGEHRGVIAGPRADLEHALVAIEAELLAQVGHHVRLRHGLAETDRIRMVGVRLRARVAPDEQMPRHAQHGIDHTRITDAPRVHVLAHHALACNLVLAPSHCSNRQCSMSTMTL
jgi:hypothetical protein